MARAIRSEKTGGRKKGVPNKETKEKILLKALLKYLIEDSMDKFKNELDSLNSKDFINVFITLYKISFSEKESIEANDALILLFKEKINKQINN